MCFRRARSRSSTTAPRCASLLGCSASGRFAEGLVHPLDEIDGLVLLQWNFRLGLDYMNQDLLVSLMFFGPLEDGCRYAWMGLRRIGLTMTHHPLVARPTTLSDSRGSGQL